MTEQPVKIINLQPKNILDIRFFPTDICNFNCTYCFPGCSDGVYRYSDNIDTIINNFNALFEFYRVHYNKNKVELNLAGGGEPTLWPYFGEFCDRLSKVYDIEFTVTTNGSRTLRWWKKHSKYLDKVTLSVHHEFVDVDHTIKVCDYLYDQGVSVTALVLMDAEYFEKCKGIIEKFKTSKNPWFIEAKPVIQFKGKDNLSYTPEMIEYMNSGLKRLPDSDFLLKNMHLFRIHESIALYKNDIAIPKRSGDYINNNENNFQGWKCNVLYENLCINFDGNLTGSCNLAIFKTENFNIYEEEFVERLEHFKSKIDKFTCPYKLCGCQPDTHITKWKI